MSLRSSRAESPWAIGITVFAAAMLIMAGGCRFFLGLAGVINDEAFARLGGNIFRFAWAIVLIAIDMLVVWALATTNQTVAARS